MKVSIIIPVYNKQRYLNTLLSQIRNQTFRDYECLLINDGSTDSSGAVCDLFAHEDSRFRVFHIPNGGVSHARNMGLEKAEGEFITFIDADDEIADGYLQNLVTCADSTDAGLVISGYQKFWDDKEQIIAVSHPALKATVPISDVLPSFAQVQRDTGIFGCCVAKIFRRDLIRDVRFDESLKLAEDFDCYLKLYAQVQSIYFDDQCLYRYRQEADNSTGLTADDQIDYLAQLKINFHYRRFLISQSTYTADNRVIVDFLVNSYLYYSLFYCSLSELNSRFSLLVTTCQDEDFVPQGSTFPRRLLLCSLSSGAIFPVKCYLYTYRLLKKIRNFSRRGFET
jgi:glycosyltransferase involved in cell wall biosynthesis